MHWFGLTSGRYWIDTPMGEVLRYTDEISKLWNSPFCHADYRPASDADWLARVQAWREKDGHKPEEIQAEYPHLRLSQIYAAIALYLDQKEAVE